MALLCLAVGKYGTSAQDTPTPPTVPGIPVSPELPSAPAIPEAAEVPDPAAPPDPSINPLLEKLTKKKRTSENDPETVRIGQPLHVGIDESIRSAVIIQSSATIDGTVEHDLVVIGGKARINGSVRGDVVNVGGGIVLGPEARIRGNAIGVLGGIRMGTNSVIGGDAFGIVGGIQKAAGAVIRGESIDQHISLPFGDWTGPDGFELPRWIGTTFKEILLKCRPLSFRVGWVWVIASLFLALHLLFTLAAPGMVRSISATLSERGATAFLMGFLALPLGALATLILIATGIGLIVVPFVGAAFLFAGLAGKAGLLHFLGVAVARRPDPAFPPTLAVVLGSLVLTALYLVPFLGMVSWAVFSMWAIGAGLLALLSRFRKEARLTPARSSIPSAPGFTPPSSPTPAPAPSTPIPSTALTLLAMTPTTSTESDPVASPQMTAPGFEGGAAEAASAGPTPSSPESPWNSPERPPQAPIPPPPSSPLLDVLTLPRVALKERLLASLLDALLLIMLFQVIDVYGIRWRILLAIGYFAGFWIWRQTTLGGIVLRLKVVRLDGRPMDSATAFVRSLSALFGILALGLGYFWSAWDPDKQGWHDKIAGTVVVRLPKTQPLV
jgi:uncharacterized RDD family membrane protein YckC